MKYVIEKEVTKQAVCAIQLNLNSPVATTKNQSNTVATSVCLGVIHALVVFSWPKELAICCYYVHNHPCPHIFIVILFTVSLGGECRTLHYLNTS